MESRVAATRALEHMPLYFIENRGQLDARVAFYVQGRDTTLYFTAEGMTLVLTEEKRGEGETRDRLERASLGRNRQGPPPQARTRHTVKLDFVGANPSPKILGADPTPTVVSYFKGRPEEWKAGLPTYASITYADLWPGIDLVYSGTADRLKYSFLVKPGADPGRVRLAYRGASGVRVNGAGQLEIETPGGVLQDDRPYAYQEIDERRVAVEASYSLDRAPGGAPHRYGFAVRPYDRTRPLVLDPAMLVYAGYIGGGGDDEANGIAVDGSGNAYVTGRTDSTQTTFPETAGPDLTYNGGTHDAFVAKVNTAGTALVYCGYIGGDDDDVGSGIAVDGSGNAYVTGRALSTEASFPVTVGPDLTHNGDGSDAFVAKVNAAGTALAYCGYIGGDGDDVGSGIAVDGSGNAYVTGFADSTEATFPVTVGPDLTYNGGLYDAFVAKVNATGTALVYCGYIGGNDYDEGLGIAVDGSGNAYVAGDTSSTQATFPVTAGPDLIYNDGGDAFVAKVNAAGTALAYCGYIGGSGGDVGVGIAVDSSGNAYVTGATASTQDTFPVTDGPDLTYNGGTFYGDAFAAKVNAAGTGLAYCGYIGGSGDDYGRGIRVDSSGDAYIMGLTASTQTSFPVAVGPDLIYNGGSHDAFVAKIAAPPSGGTSTPTPTPSNTPTRTPTNTPTRTPTNTPTRTPTNTPTGALTNTPTRTPTSTPTNTPTLTPTNTPTPTPPSMAGTSFYTLTPCRIVDTRNPVGPLGGPSLTGGASRTFVVINQCSLPATATAIAVNVTETGAQGSGNLRVYPGGTSVPNTSTMNFSVGQTRANNAVVPLGASGDISVFAGIGTGLHVDFILDIVGYFAP